jgi:hypothetical protein
MPCGKEWRPLGEWKAKWWCYTDYNFGGDTYCTNGYGTWNRSGWDPCVGKEGWCKGGLLE